ncbi:MAG: hypothetical protein ACMUIA_04995 [bacterium]
MQADFHERSLHGSGGTGGPGTWQADPLIAKQIFVEPERQAGTVADIDTNQRTLVVDEDGDPATTYDRQIVDVPLGAKILECEEDDGDKNTFLSFSDIEVNDSIVCFGLPVCQDSSRFNAFVVIVVQ